MKNIFIFFALSFLILNQKDLMSQTIIYDFNNQSDLSSWVIVNDDVMGGISSCEMSLDNNGNGIFEGQISTANNGGFSSIRLNLDKIDVREGAYLQIRLKGDNKEYQFRIKTNRMDYYSYVIPFKTSDEWETIRIPLKDMYPSFRGRKLDMNNYSDDYFEQITFLVGNKKNETFKLSIDSIVLFN
jgi:NADH dehydrogenase [ubiquinone] 1 alpha subcomplex assembly factor 1|tara:strand:- start:22 stop:576 length:555 start_codon:yes stop_codon:yes gene_type:complete